MKRRITALFALALLFAAATLRADESEIERLRRQIDKQAEEIERLRQAVQQLAGVRSSLRDEVVAPGTHAPRSEDLPPSSTQPTTSPFATVKFNGLVQGWYTSGNGGVSDTFRIRRAELKLSGDVNPRVGWTVMIDPSKTLSQTTINGQPAINQSGRALQDAFLTAAPAKGVVVTVGQFKLPLSREGLESSAALDTIERALFASDRGRGGNYGDVRDVGVSVRRSVAQRYDLIAGVFNGVGESMNDVDRNDQKVVAARLNVFVPGVEGLQLGTSGARSAGSGVDRHERAGVDLLFTRGPWKFKSEIAAGSDGAIDRRGFYAHLGARVRQRFELVARVDQWDPDTSSDLGLAASRERDYLVGGSALVYSTLRLQANVVHKTFADAALRSRNLLLLNVQTSW